MSGPYTIKSEMMKFYIWLQTTDGSIEQVEQDVALFCPLIRQEMHAGMGSGKTRPISLPVNLIILCVILDYCRFHHLPGRSDLERKQYNDKFVHMNKTKLSELYTAAKSLQLSQLVDLIYGSLLRICEEKSPEEIRQTFGLPDDVTEEDQLEPIKIAIDDPQVRLLNKLYARKRKDSEEKKTQKLKNVEAEASRVDDRSIDELMSFINGENEGPEEAQPSKSKKKNGKGKEKRSELCLEVKFRPSAWAFVLKQERRSSLHPFNGNGCTTKLTRSHKWCGFDLSS